VTTSNKRDAVDATRGPRSTVGPVWVFDPQRLIDEPPRWWWNPLGYVTDEVKAATLADVFTAAHTDPRARTDAFFDPKGQKVVAALLLAAALAGRTIEQAYLWVADPRDDEPVSVLREHAHRLLAASLAAEINAPDKQRGGVYGTAGRSSPSSPTATPSPGSPPARTASSSTRTSSCAPPAPSTASPRRARAPPARSSPA